MDMKSTKKSKIMGKEREGKFHPRKGKPSDSVQTESVGLKPISSGAYEENLDIAEKYTVGDDEPAPNLHLRHRNRNVDKREERKQEKSETKNTKEKREKHTETEVILSAEEITLPLTKEKLSELANYQSSCCVSFFLPTHQAGAEVNAMTDQTYFKTMLQQVTALLKQKKIDDAVIAKMLKPGFELIRSDAFWRNLTTGLAVFVSDDYFKYLKMPCQPKEKIMVNSSFYVSPLMPVVSNSDYFYLLVLSKKQALLYRADAFGMVQIELAEMPNGVDDVVHFEEKDDQNLFRTGSSGAGGGAVYHGMGAGQPDDKANLAMYFDEVDETLWKEVLGKETAPLLLAGVEYLIPIYKSVAQYNHIWKDAITGNQEHADLNALYQQARKKMQPYFDERHVKALQAYGNSSATELTSSIPEDVIPAAHYKRVWHLFVREDAHLWGTFDEMNNKLVIHEKQQEGDEDLIDKAISKTILNAGEVHRLPAERMPANSPIAALMRYSI
jgi:hypothetical protein